METDVRQSASVQTGQGGNLISINAPEPVLCKSLIINAQRPPEWTAFLLLVVLLCYDRARTIFLPV